MVKSLDSCVLEFLDVSGTFFNILFYIDFTSMGNDIKYFTKITTDELGVINSMQNTNEEFFYFLSDMNTVNCIKVKIDDALKTKPYDVDQYLDTCGKVKFGLKENCKPNRLQFQMVSNYEFTEEIIFHRKIGKYVFVQERNDYDYNERSSCYISKYKFEDSKLIHLSKINIEIDPRFNIKSVYGVEIIKFHTKASLNQIEAKEGVILLLNTENVAEKERENRRVANKLNARSDTSDHEEDREKYIHLMVQGFNLDQEGREIKVAGTKTGNKKYPNRSIGMVGVNRSKGFVFVFGNGALHYLNDF